MAGIVANSLSNLLSIKADPAGAMDSASSGFRVSGSLFGAINTALDRKELAHQERIDAQRNVINRLEATQIDMTNQRELKALAHSYSVDLSNLGYTHQQSLQGARFGHDFAMQSQRTSDNITRENAGFNHKLALEEKRFGYKSSLEKLKNSNRPKQKSKTATVSAPIKALFSLPIK